MGSFLLSCLPEEEGRRDSFYLLCHKQHPSGQKVTKVGLCREGFFFFLCHCYEIQLKVIEPVFLYFSLLSATSIPTTNYLQKALHLIVVVLYIRWGYGGM